MNKLLLIDIGGTNMRYATAYSDSDEISSINKKVFNEATFYENLEELIKEHNINTLIMSVAGPKIDNSITMTNKNFSFNQDNLKEKFKLRTDSKYVIEGYTKRIINWKKNGWKTSSGKSVQNLDLWQKIDQLRINGLVMEYVKGHSGDKQNDRVDKIATNYSKGISLESKLKESESSADFFEKNAPAEIQELFSRNELIQKFADKKYLLSSPELNTLLGEEYHLKIIHYSLFEWRNWRLIPKDKKYWIIEKKEA